MIEIGSTLESAVWVTGEETPEQRRDYERRVAVKIAQLCHAYGVMMGPLRSCLKKPGDDRVPQVPDHVSGPDVRLLVIEADVVSRTRAFVGELTGPDLQRLRALTRKHADRPLSDVQCDDYIEALGPDAAMDALRRGLA